MLSATGPNRTYLWRGTINADQADGTFVAYSGGDELGKFLPWQSYPETLQAAGRELEGLPGQRQLRRQRRAVLQDVRRPRPVAGRHRPGARHNVFYDNGLATVPEPLDAESSNGDNLANAIKADVMAGTLPQVSWVVTNQQYSEHPDGAPTDGAYYIGKVLQALNADPDVFNSTLVIIDFDENDGQFDHVPPPVPPAGTAGRVLHRDHVSVTRRPAAGRPRASACRCCSISPWTRGGWVTSEVSDHTSVIQFLEKWTAAIGKPAHCPNISAWRRSVCGDLTGAFDFEHPVYGLPDLPVRHRAGRRGAARTTRCPPATRCRPRRPARKPARPLPYQPNANLTGFGTANGTVTASLALSNSGPHAAKASHFSVYNNT